jgi:hypothetical protein
LISTVFTVFGTKRVLLGDLGIIIKNQDQTQ